MSKVLYGRRAHNPAPSPNPLIPPPEEQVARNLSRNISSDQQTADLAAGRPPPPVHSGSPFATSFTPPPERQIVQKTPEVTEALKREYGGGIFNAPQPNQSRGLERLREERKHTPNTGINKSHIEKRKSNHSQEVFSKEQLDNDRIGTPNPSTADFTYEANEEQLKDDIDRNAQTVFEQYERREEYYIKSRETNNSSTGPSSRLQSRAKSSANPLASDHYIPEQMISTTHAMFDEAERLTKEIRASSSGQYVGIGPVHEASRRNNGNRGNIADDVWKFGGTLGFKDERERFQTDAAAAELAIRTAEIERKQRATDLKRFPIEHIYSRRQQAQEREEMRWAYMNQLNSREQALLDAKKQTSRSGKNSVGYDLITSRYSATKEGQELKLQDVSDDQRVKKRGLILYTKNNTFNPLTGEDAREMARQKYIPE